MMSTCERFEEEDRGELPPLFLSGSFESGQRPVPLELVEAFLLGSSEGKKWSMMI